MVWGLRVGWWFRCCVVGVRRRGRCWVRWRRCGCVGWMWIGVRCSLGRVLGVWRCRLMLFSGSVFGWRVGRRVWGMWSWWGSLLLVIRCWVLLLGWLAVGAGCLRVVWVWIRIRGSAITWCWVSFC